MGGRLQVVLDPPYSMADPKAHSFLPGDRVSGRVIFSAKDGEKIKTLSISLKGSFYTKATEWNGGVEKTGTYRFEIFNIQKTLVQGPTKMPQSTNNYPFAFEIPKEFSSPAAEWKGSSKLSDLYSHPSGPLRPIPPTCEDAIQLSNQYSDWKIAYSLSAKAEKSMLNLDDELPLVIVHGRPSLDPGPGPVLHDARGIFNQRYRLTSGIPRALSKGEALKQGFHQNDSNYALCMSLHAKAINAIIVGEPYTIAFTLQMDPSQSHYQPPVPEFQLKDYNINLCSSTSVCTYHDRNKKNIHTIGTSAFAPFEMFPSKQTVNTPLTINKPIEVKGTLPDLRKATPSFKTVLFERRYYFQIHAHVSCLDNTHKLTILLPFWLHSPKFLGQVSSVETAGAAYTSGPISQISPPSSNPVPPPAAQVPSPEPRPSVLQPSAALGQGPSIQTAGTANTSRPMPQSPPSSGSPVPSLVSQVSSNAPQLPASQRSAARFCGNCGARRSTDAASFCTQCGTRF